MLTAFYYFINGAKCNSTLKPFLQLKNVFLEYESKLHILFAKIINYQPEFLIVDGDSVVLNSDFIEYFNEKSPFYVPLIFILYENKSEVPNTSNSGNYVYLTYEDFLFKFSSFLTIIQNKCQLVKNIEKFQLTKFNTILSFLFKINFSFKTQGTIFLKDCIKFYINDSNSGIVNMCDIYNYVAKCHNTTIANVERSIRIAIQSAWEKLNAKNTAQELGLDIIFFEKQPSCRELIVLASEYLLESYKEINIKRMITETSKIEL